MGEEITLHYELLTQADVQGLEYLEPPRFPGCWAEDLEKPEKPVGHRDVVDGRTVMRFTLLKKLVSGLNPGTVNIPEAKIRTSVRGSADPSGDPFGFFPRPQVMDLVARALSLRDPSDPGRCRVPRPVGPLRPEREAGSHEGRTGEARDAAHPALGHRQPAHGDRIAEARRPERNAVSAEREVRFLSNRPHTGRDRMELRPRAEGERHRDDPAGFARRLRPGREAHRDELTAPLTLVAEGGAPRGAAAGLTTAETTLPLLPSPAPSCSAKR